MQDVGSRLDKFLVTNIPEFSRSKIQKHIKNGKVMVNGLCKKTGYKLEINDEINIFNNLMTSKSEDYLIPENIKLDIIYEDLDIIIINKPANLVVHPGAGNKRGTLANGLKYHFKKLSKLNGIQRPGIVHRLDSGTSGIMIIAKTDSSHNSLAKQFQHREVKKEYTAITWGNFSPKKGVINSPIGRKKRDPTSFNIDMDGKKSETAYKLLENFNHFSLVSFFPKTGRTHQIRVHASSMGFPIFGDEKYGGGKTRIKGFLPEYGKIYLELLDYFEGHALHANKITFLHPITNKKVTFRTEIPKHFLKFIDSVKHKYEK